MSSKGEARRAIANNGIKINDIMVTNEKKIINQEDLLDQSYVKISYGKKKHYIIKTN